MIDRKYEACHLQLAMRFIRLYYSQNTRKNKGNLFEIFQSVSFNY
jgi:hypothetical protein